MAYVDYTTLTEVDPNNRIGVATNTLTATSLTRNESAYVYDDKTAAHFDGDFEHLMDCQSTASGSLALASVWALTNVIDDLGGIYVASGDFLSLQFLDNSTVLQLKLVEVDGGNFYNDFYTPSSSTRYYCKIKRVEGTGTYGTIYCYIYDDSGRTNLVDTLSVALHTSKKDFRYLFGMSSWDSSSAATMSCDSRNLDLQEADGSPWYYYAQQ